MVVDAAIDFSSENFIDQKLLQLDHDVEFPIDLIRQVCGEGLGVHLIFIPEQYGGMGGGAYDSYRGSAKPSLRLTLAWPPASFGEPLPDLSIFYPEKDQKISRGDGQISGTYEGYSGGVVSKLSIFGTTWYGESREEAFGNLISSSAGIMEGNRLLDEFGSEIGYIKNGKAYVTINGFRVLLKEN